MKHPITPPPEFLNQWSKEYWDNPSKSTGDGEKHIAAQAARWGADQELEACCEWANATGWEGAGDSLRAARRPKPPSLKEQALQALGHLDKGAESQMDTTEAVDTIRRALEQLDD